MRYWVAKLMYHATWPVWYMLFKFFFGYHFVYEDLKVKKMRGPLIIVANHGSWLDPFLLSGAFPMFSAVYPIHFATYHYFFKHPATAIFVRMYGSFPVKKGVPMEELLAPAVHFLERKQAVGIFPSGKREHRGRPRNPRRGAAYLALATGAPILPIRIEGNKGLNFRRVILRKEKITLHVQKPFRIQDYLDTKNQNDKTGEKLRNDAAIIITEKIHGL